MSELIEICDDFDLEKIAFCGQCFRVKTYEDNSYRFITGEHVLYIRKDGERRYSVSCGLEEWETVWTRYFDLQRDYARLRGQEAFAGGFVQKAMAAGSGLRILRQDPWEMLVTFIISQRKNIPAIAGAVETLAGRYGHRANAKDTAFTFPTAEELSGASEEDFRKLGLGYRAPYVRDAVEKALSGELDLQAIASYDDGRLFDALTRVRGVGKKVADCVCLFGYGRCARAPVDVWISRAIEEEFEGENPFPSYGEHAGIIQQYIFYFYKQKAGGSHGNMVLRSRQH